MQDIPTQKREPPTIVKKPRRTQFAIWIQSRTVRQENTYQATALQRNHISQFTRIGAASLIVAILIVVGIVLLLQVSGNHHSRQQLLPTLTPKPTLIIDAFTKGT